MPKQKEGERVCVCVCVSAHVRRSSRNARDSPLHNPQTPPSETLGEIRVNIMHHSMSRLKAPFHESV